MIIKEVASQVPKNLLLKWFYKRPKIMSDIETIEYIVKYKCSLTRFGDGEIRSIFGYDLAFQVRNEELSNKLKEVKNTEKCLVALPNVFYKCRLKNIKDDEKRYRQLFE